MYTYLHSSNKKVIIRREVVEINIYGSFHSNEENKITKELRTVMANSQNIGTEMSNKVSFYFIYVHIGVTVVVQLFFSF